MGLMRKAFRAGVRSVMLLLTYCSLGMHLDLLLGRFRTRSDPDRSSAAAKTQKFPATVDCPLQAVLAGSCRGNRQIARDSAGTGFGIDRQSSVCRRNHFN